MRTSSNLRDSLSVKIAKMEKRIVIGLLGTIGSGKGTAAKFLKKKYGFKIVTMGNMIRMLARKLKIPVSRKSLQDLQEKYRKRYGEDYFINLVWQKINASKHKRWIIDGIRNNADAFVSKKNDAVLVFIDAKPEIRFERMKKRGRRGFSKTLEEFKEEEKREWKLFNFKKTINYAQYKIDNSRGQKELFCNIDKLIKK